jgi:hypothetical protein
MELDRSQALRLFCLLWQADRSIDSGLWSGWPSVKQYFADGRLETLRRAAGSIEVDVSEVSPAEVDRLRARLSRKGWGSGVGNAWRARRPRIRLSGDEERFLGHTLDNLTASLAEDDLATDRLQQLRFDIGVSAASIHRQLGGVPKEALQIESLGHPKARKSYSLEEVVGMMEGGQQR